MGVMLKRHGVPASELSALGSSSMPAIEYVRITFPDRTVYGGEVIDTGGFELEVIWTPGHSIGHVCLYEPSNQLLFSGDHILPHITPNVSYHVQSGDNPLGDYLNALHKLENLPVAKILPAHEHIFEDLPGRIKEIGKHHREREEEIRQVISGESHSAYDISSRLSWNIPDSDWDKLPSLHKRVAVTETIAHLEYMRWAGKAQRVFEDDLLMYRSW
jgi:glyoxylase-like metal-dependent hydrolase (beta-lactamase superfamily II)